MVFTQKEKTEKSLYTPIQNCGAQWLSFEPKTFISFIHSYYGVIDKAPNIKRRQRMRKAHRNEAKVFSCKFNQTELLFSREVCVQTWLELWSIHKKCTAHRHRQHHHLGPLSSQQFIKPRNAQNTQIKMAIERKWKICTNWLWESRTHIFAIKSVLSARFWLWFQFQFYEMFSNSVVKYPQNNFRSQFVCQIERYLQICMWFSWNGSISEIRAKCHIRRKCIGSRLCQSLPGIHLDLI